MGMIDGREVTIWAGPCGTRLRGILKKKTHRVWGFLDLRYKGEESSKPGNLRESRCLGQRPRVSREFIINMST